MSMEKLFIKNRKDWNIAVVLEEQKNPKGLAFVMHGLSGTKNEPHIETIASAFTEKEFTVVSFDTTNTIGESDGKLEDATLTNYYEDLEDVISWASSQKWYEEPFVLAGHSLGAISSALFAEKYPKKVKALAPISTVVAGRFTEETSDFKKIGKDWEKKGIREWESSSNLGLVKRLKWSHVEDRRKYDLLPNVDKLKMPVLMIVGSLDNVTPLEHQQLFYDKLSGEKELHVINGSYHTFREREHLDEIRQIFLNWIDKI